MKSNKSVTCKCERCNKPFKAHFKEEKMLCKSCKAVLDEEKLQAITGKTIPKTMTRTVDDRALNSVRSLVVSGKLLLAEMEAKEAEKKAEEDRLNEVAMTLKCKDCGEEFDIKVGEKEFYESKGLCLPARCSFCRSERRREKAEARRKDNVV